MRASRMRKIAIIVVDLVPEASEASDLRAGKGNN